MKNFFQLFQAGASFFAPQLKSEDSKEGIKETKEALIGVNEVSLFMCEKLQDGVQFSDATDFYSKLTSDEAFKAKVKEAYEGYDKIPSEVKDVDAGEGLELASVQVGYVEKFLACFKKQ